MPDSIALVLDCSPYARNGDFSPSIFLEETDVANYFCSSSVNDNGPSAMSLVAMGSTPKLLCPLTNIRSALTSSLSGLAPDPQLFFTHTDILAAIQLGVLAALQHTAENPAYKVIVLCCSDLTFLSIEEATAACTKLRDNNVVLEIYSFGRYTPVNAPVLTAMADAAGGLSRLRTIDGTHATRLVDGIIQSSGNPMDAFNQYGFLDDEDDDLRLAIQLSMQDMQAQQHTAASDVSDPIIAESVTASKPSTDTFANTEQAGAKAGAANDDINIFGLSVDNLARDLAEIEAEHKNAAKEDKPKDDKPADQSK